MESNRPNFNFESSKIGSNEIKSEVKKLLTETAEAQESIGLFTIKSGNSWMEQAKNEPIPNMLFGEFWFEDEVCILFADTNLGKSILAVQIGNSISKGEPINGFKLEGAKQPILYFDFELSKKQFENRYSANFEIPYIFDDNFLRVEIDPDAEIPEKQSFEEYLNYSLEQSIIRTGAKIIIIDNLTYLRNETEKAKDALPLMKHLKALKRKYQLSILALAHTPKRDLTKPITKNDLQGSKMLINFCDSSFSIGESYTDKSLRYIKQIKQRNTEQIYDADNVAVCMINKPSNFLQFEFVNLGTEYEHLKQFTEKDKLELEKNVQEIIQNEPGISAYAIAKRLCKDDNKFDSFKVKISRIVKKFNENGNSSNI